MTVEEEKLKRLQDRKKDLERQMTEMRVETAKISEIIRDLAPKVTAIKNKREWEQGAPARAAMRATPEYQEWREQMMKGELPWQQK